MPLRQVENEMPSLRSTSQPFQRLFPLLLSLSSLFVAWASYGQQPSESRPSSDKLRVLSYNIHHGEGVDGKLDLERIAKVILSVQPDIVSLQEVDRNVPRSKSVDQPAELAKLTKMEAIFEKNIDLQGGEYGNAILTKLPILKYRNEKLPMIQQGEARGVLVAELQWGRFGPIGFLATHFDHRPNAADRVASAKRVNELVASSNMPSLLVGDLNATVDSEPLDLLMKEWSHSNKQPLPTIPVQSPTRQIDFILTRSTAKARWNTSQIRVLEEEVASDHRAIFAELTLLEPIPQKSK